MSLLVNLDVPAIAPAVAFYTQGLGLTVGRTFDDQFVELLGGGVPIYLLTKPAGPGASPTATLERTYERHWTPVHLDFVVEDIAAAKAKVLAAGATLERDITEHAYGQLALFADPFGHGFCLLQFNNRGYDALL